jgi:hypothetical protein
VIATVIWGYSYGFKGNGDPLHFWGCLSPEEQELCRKIVARVEAAPAEQISKLDRRDIGFARPQIAL